MVSSNLSVSYSSAGGDNESIRRPVSHRSLDFSLNQSLRHMDTRYVENDRMDNDHANVNHQGHDDASHNSGFLSRTNEEALDDISFWSGEDLQEPEDENDPNEIHDHYDSSDDPRSTFFGLLDRHCSVYPGETQDNHNHNNNNNNNDYSNHSKGGAAHSNDWQPIREWLHAMTTSYNEDNGMDDLPEDPHQETRNQMLQAAILDARGRSGETVLHVACERSVPLDILEMLLSIYVPSQDEDEEPPTSAKSLLYQNQSGKSLALCSTIDGWLPLHYACNYPNSYAVVERLVETFPEAKTHADLKGRTPLHFAMREENMNRPEVVALLASAAGIADDNGILVRNCNVIWLG